MIVSISECMWMTVNDYEHLWTWVITSDYEHQKNMSDCDILKQFMNENEEQSVNENKE